MSTLKHSVFEIKQYIRNPESALETTVMDLPAPQIWCRSLP